MAIPSTSRHGDDGEELGELGEELADLQLDDEAQGLLADLDASQAEVERLIAEHRIEADQLGGMRESIKNELHDLQDETWRLQLFGELESLKQQLAALKNLEADLDAAEAILDATEPEAPGQASSAASASAATISNAALAAAVANGAAAKGLAKQTADLPAADQTDKGHAEGGEADDDEDYDPVAIMEMQAKLDQELAEMFAQLQAVKQEAATVNAHKKQLEAELAALLADTQEADDQEDEARWGMSAGALESMQEGQEGEAAEAGTD